MIYHRIAQNAPSLGNAGKRVRATTDYTVPDRVAAAQEFHGHVLIAAWGVAVFVILAVTAWCLR